MHRRDTNRGDRARCDSLGYGLPVGIHRGALAGLDGEERKKKLEEHKRTIHPHGEPLRYETIGTGFRSYGYGYRVPQGVRVVKQFPSRALGDLIANIRKDRLVAFARTMGLSRISALRKERIVERVLADSDGLSRAIEAQLRSCSNAQFAGFKLLLGKPDATFIFTGDDHVRRDAIEALEPLVWMYYLDGTYCAFMPPEIAQAAAAVDLAAIERERDRTWQIPLAIATLKEFFGVARVADVAPCCQELFGFEPTVHDVLEAIKKGTWSLLNDSCGIRRIEHGCWPKDIIDAKGYIVAYDLTDTAVETLAQERMRWHAKVAPYRAGAAWIYRYEPAIDYETYRIAEVKARDEFIQTLLGARAKGVIKEPGRIDPAVATRGPRGWELQLPEARAMRTWLDAHVPDEQDDFTYADETLERLISERNRSAQPCNMMETARELGLFSCTFDVKELLDLLVALEEALPSWHLNGWTPRDLHEAMASGTVPAECAVSAAEGDRLVRAEG